MLKEEIFNWLNNSDFVKDYTVLDYKSDISSFYLKMKIVFIDNSILFSREYFDLNNRDYSFHWQNNENKLITRWDNAPFHKEIKTFPHHKHIENEIIVESNNISLNEILNIIYKNILT